MDSKLPTIYENVLKPIDRELYEKGCYFNVGLGQYSYSSSSSSSSSSPPHSPIHSRHLYSYTILQSTSTFNSILVEKSLMVYQGSSKYKHYLRYFDGFFVLKSLFKKKKVISTKGIKSCTRINYTITFDTFEHGFVILKFGKLENAMCIEYFVKSIISDN